MHGNIGAVAHGHAHIGGCQGRRIIDTVADHGHGVTARLQRLNTICFFTRQDIGHHLSLFRSKAKAPGHHIGRALVVARNHHGAYATLT